MLLFSITSFFVHDLRKHLNNIYLSVYAHTCIIHVYICVHGCQLSVHGFKIFLIHCLTFKAIHHSPQSS